MLKKPIHIKGKDQVNTLITIKNIGKIKEVDLDDIYGMDNQSDTSIQNILDFFHLDATAEFNESEFKKLYLIMSNLLLLEDSYNINYSTDISLDYSIDTNFNLTVMMRYPNKFEFNDNELESALNTFFVTY